jgi:hypothetical protein
VSAPQRGGVTVKVLTGRSAPDLLRYRDEVAEKQSEGYLIAAQQHCSFPVHEEIREFEETRVRYGTDGAKRTAKATYEKVDPETGLHASGQRGTHVEYFDGKRNRKRPVRAGETPTHLRIEPGALTVKESEAVHTIVAAGDDLVNPENPEDLERFMDAVVAWRREDYPGLQESMWLERNGDSGLAHVHIASNATVYEDFERDGVQYRAGQKMAGALTRVHDARAGFEQFLDRHPEHGLEQSLARVGSEEYERAQVRDGQKSYWEKKRGRESNQDRIRREAELALGPYGVGDRDEYVAALGRRGIEVTETGLRRGAPTKNHDYLYRVEGAKQGVRGSTLGPDYAYGAVGEHLEAKAQGRAARIEGKQSAGAAKRLPFEAKPLTSAERDELEALRSGVAALAAEEEARQQGLDPATVPSREQAGLPRATVRVDAPALDIDSMHARRAAQEAEAEDALDAAVREMEDGRADRSAKYAPAEEVEQQPVDEPQPEPKRRREFRAEAEHDREEVTRLSDGVELRPLSEEDRQRRRAAVPGPGRPAEDQGAPSAQEAPTTPETASGPGVVWRSDLRDAAPLSEAYGKDVPKVRARIEGLAQIEEDYHGRMPSTLEERQEFEQRIKGIGGVRQQFLEDYGFQIQPAMRERLEERAEWMEKAREAYDEQKLEYAAFQEGKTAGRAREELAKHGRAANAAGRRSERLRQDVANGEYMRPVKEREQEKAERVKAQSKKVSASDRFSAKAKAARETQDHGLGR